MPKQSQSHPDAEYIRSPASRDLTLDPEAEEYFEFFFCFSGCDFPLQTSGKSFFKMVMFLIFSTAARRDLRLFELINVIKDDQLLKQSIPNTNLNLLSVHPRFVYSYFFNLLVYRAKVEFGPKIYGSRLEELLKFGIGVIENPLELTIISESSLTANVWNNRHNNVLDVRYPKRLSMVLLKNWHALPKI